MATLSVPAKLENLEAINAFLGMNIPERYMPVLSQVELAAEELLVNVFSYAYPHGAGTAEIHCHEVWLDDVPYLCFKARDWGEPFNPFQDAPTPNLTADVEDRPIGGLGVYLIKSVVAHYAYSFYEQANTIELYFARPE